MDIIQLSCTIFLNETVFYFLVQHMFHFLLESFAFIINDVFDKSNEQTFSYRHCKVNEKKFSQSVSFLFSRDLLTDCGEQTKQTAASSTATSSSPYDCAYLCVTF